MSTLYGDNDEQEREREDADTTNAACVPPYTTTARAGPHSLGTHEQQRSHHIT